MPRPPRLQFAGALYHVTVRGNGRGRVFCDDADRKRFMQQLQSCLETYEVVLYAYALMDNHWHLLVRTVHPNLSRFMQRLNTSYALYCRYKHKKPGHRLEGRYKAKLVQGDEYILTLSRYIHLNPVKVRAMRGMTKSERRKHLERYAWSSYGGYVEERRREEFVCYDVLRGLGEDPRQARRRYRTYVLACLMEADEDLRRALDRSGHVVGDERYVQESERKLRSRKTGTARDRDVAFPEERIGVGRIDAVVTEEFGVTPAQLKQHGRSTSSGLAKTAAIELACRLTGMTQRDIGARYGGITSQGVSIARKRASRALNSELVNRLATRIRNGSDT